MINSYEFGKITIDNKEYTYDVRIFKDKVLDWWRKEGHSVCKEDLDEVVDSNPELIIFGTGYNDMMDVSSEIIDWLSKKKY